MQGNRISLTPFRRTPCCRLTMLPQHNCAPLSVSNQDPPMRPEAKNLPRVYLSPGDLHITTQPTLIETVLGSCVALSLHCPASGKAALCHAMLPSGPSGNFHYMDAAIEHMVNGLQRRGVTPCRLVAKLFGGADMFSRETANIPNQFLVGRCNLERAYEVLERYKIPIKSSDVGGNHGRKLLFFTDTGQVYVKLLRR